LTEDDAEAKRVRTERLSKIKEGLMIRATERMEERASALEAAGFARASDATRARADVVKRRANAGRIDG